MFDWTVGAGIALGFLIGLPAHDLAHHSLAVILGDKTPRLMGRVPPRLGAVADPLGSYILPAVFIVAGAFGAPTIPFGWTKTHAFGLRGMPHGRRDVILVSLAGPAATAGLAAGMGALAAMGTGDLQAVLYYALITLSALTVVELLPIPGRDGGRILGQFLSPAGRMKLEELTEYAVLFLLVLFLFLDTVVGNMVVATCGLLSPLNCI